MSGTVLSRLHSKDLSYGPPLDSPQAQVDSLVSRFVEEAADPKTLASLTAGGLAYRFGKIGVMGLGSSSVYRPLSLVFGLGSEVAAFEFTNRTLLTLSPHSSTSSGQAPNPLPRGEGVNASYPQGHRRDTLHASRLWAWNGPGGWKQALINDFVTFGLLKGAGYLSRETNVVFQHTFSSTAMVAGHQTTALFGITPKPEGTLAEQFLHAEITNLQLGAGVSLVHSMAPGISALERGLDLSVRRYDRANAPTHHFSQWALAAVPKEPPEAFPLLIMTKGGTRRGRKSAQPHLSPDLPPEEIEKIVAIWREILDSKQPSLKNKMEGILTFLKRTRLGFEVGGEPFVLKSIDFLRDIARREEDIITENSPEGVTEILCSDYALFRNPRLAEALSEALNEIVITSKTTESLWLSSHFVLELLKVSHVMKEIEVHPAIKILQKLAESTDGVLIAEIAQGLQRFGLSHPNPSVVQASQEVLEKIWGQGMPSIPRSELVLEDNPLSLFKSGPTLLPPEKIPEPVIDFSSMLRSFKGLLPLPKILHPNPEVAFYLRYARQLHQEGLRENALQVIAHLQSLVNKYEDANLRTHAYISLGEVRAELGDRKGAEEVFYQVKPLIIKIQASSRPTHLTHLWVKQKKALDPGAEQTYALVLTAIEALTPAERPAAYGNLSQKLAEVGELPLARKIIDKMPAGYHRLWSLGDLAAKWAELSHLDPQYLTFAVATFHEARTQLKKTRELQGRDYYQYGLNHLINRLTQAGEPFREEALALIEESRHFILREIHEPWRRYSAFEALVSPMLQLKRFTEIKALLRGDLGADRNRRSRLLMLLACALAKSGKFREAKNILDKEALTPGDRFLSLMGLIPELEKGGPHRRREAAKALEQIKRTILQNVSSYSGFIQLAKYLAERGDLESSARMFDEAQKAIVGDIQTLSAQEEQLAYLRLERATSLGLRRLHGDPTPLWEALQKAASDSDFSQIRIVATLLGFHEDGRRHLLTNLYSLPPETRSWIEVWALYGATLNPRGEESRQEILKGFRKIVESLPSSDNLRAAKIHLAALQGFRQVAPGLLQAELMAEVKKRLGLSTPSAFSFSTEVPVSKGGIEKDSFDPSDQIFYQTLSWLALHGSPMAQVFITDLMEASTFPSPWKPSLQRALKQNGHRKKEAPKVLN